MTTTSICRCYPYYFVSCEVTIIFVIFSLSPLFHPEPGPVLARSDHPGFSHRGSISSRPQSERSDSGVGMMTPRSASSQRGVLDEAAGGGNGDVIADVQGGVNTLERIPHSSRLPTFLLKDPCEKSKAYRHCNHAFWCLEIQNKLEP